MEPQLPEVLQAIIWDRYLDLETKARAHTDEWRLSLLNRDPLLWPAILKNRHWWEESACRALRGRSLLVSQQSRIYTVAAKLEWPTARRLRFSASLPGHRNSYYSGAEEALYGSISVKLADGVRVLVGCPALIYCTSTRFLFSLTDSAIDAPQYNSSSLTEVEREWLRHNQPKPDRRHRIRFIL